MPQQDSIHVPVRNALIADGWIITHEQKKVTIHKTAQVYGIVDILAEQHIQADREGRKIAVEVKGFLSDSPSTDVMEAVGQYAAYRSWYARIDPTREVWLAVPKQRYLQLLTDPGAQAVILDEKIKIILVDILAERITQWID
jgi:hypothetical protein